jgi:hypothetical protein
VQFILHGETAAAEDPWSERIGARQAKEKPSGEAYGG